MYFHGIDYRFVELQYPVLSPRLTLRDKKPEQKEDRQHLFERFGLEPVHLLKSSKTYTVLECLRACFSFGDTVFAFHDLPLPTWKLSKHEFGVEAIDLRRALWVATANESVVASLRTHFQIPILVWKKGRSRDE